MVVAVELMLALEHGRASSELLAPDSLSGPLTRLDAIVTFKLSQWQGYECVQYRIIGS